MKLFTKCKSCKKEIEVKSSARTRPELENDKGSKFTLDCTSCGLKSENHVNDVRATEDYKIILGGLALSAILTLVLWAFGRLIGTLSAAIPILIWRNENSSVHTFNMYKTRR